MINIGDLLYRDIGNAGALCLSKDCVLYFNTKHLFVCQFRLGANDVYINVQLPYEHTVVLSRKIF